MASRCVQVIPSFSKINKEQLIYLDGSIQEIDKLDKKLELISWSYARGMEPLCNTDYAKLLIGSQELKMCLPKTLFEQLELLKTKIEIFINSCRESKVNLSEFSFNDLIPKSILIDYLNVLNQMTQYVFENYEKPGNYSVIKNGSIVLTEMGSKPLKICVPEQSFQDPNLKPYSTTLETMQSKNFVSYNIFSSKTGRIYPTSNSFPINIKKELRQFVKPQNDYFLELDYNAFDLRVFIGLMNKPQPEEDIHDFNVKHIWNNSIDRQEAKRKIFAWLYDQNNFSGTIEKFYDKTILLDKFYRHSIITNTYGMKLECDQFHALNYLIQSTGSMIFLEQLFKIYTLIKTKYRYSFISLINQDSILIDGSLMDNLDHEELRSVFSQTGSETMKVNLKKGPDWFHMQDLTDC